MSSAVQASSAFEEQPDPSPLQRVLLVFSTPSRAFAGPRLATSWWLPYLIMMIVGFGAISMIGAKVSWDTVAKNNLAASPKQQARLDALPAEQQQQQLALTARITRTIAFISPVIAPLIAGALISGVFLATFRFGLGAQVHFAPLFAVYFFSSLPMVLKGLLEAVTLALTAGVDTFQINNPLGSNPAYYLQGSGLPHWALSLLSWLDVFLIWQIWLLIIGCAVVARISRSRAALVVLGWTLVSILLGTAGALFT
ncbi:YIP1 family protein [Acidipila sp. EB88]|uniref:YIP1 family protein n=1 Tax=Acidipila sp. EB88 TaxID=2305226 RepID=UPI000F5EC40D|nr:YIP1 family protein [Acidipila sp. EB88]RRA48405.1 hypothetical protein D1Y84_09015 [Acidipila sp. EB88]